ncbi:hypothetical protein J4209_05530 [Candidatus Woesearchaeota archaeon]|nr:hypothetical protein [Candidatus Woesearchaeota archaeon]
MNSNNQKNSKTQRIFNIFRSNPDTIFNIRKIQAIFNNLYQDKINNFYTSTVVSRLHIKNKLSRTPTQLNSGYSYSAMNKKKIDEIYKNYLLPYDFGDNERILRLITQNKFEKLSISNKLNFSKIKDFDFIKKYGLDYFYNNKVLNFLVANIGFVMCDGHIRKNLQHVQYYFNQKEDAKLFKSGFNSIFPHENPTLEYKSYCFTINLCSKEFAKLINYLGVPTGNKVFKPFLIPKWIYNGPEEFKRIFLSIIYGNEGSKPQNNRWRIQFVLSKTEEYVTNLLEFLNQIRTMLAYFGITTSYIQLRKQKEREFCGRFYIKGKDNLLKFYNKIGFAYASEKQEVLESLLKRDKLIN